MTGISPPLAKLTVLVTRRVLPGRGTPHPFVAKLVLSPRSGSPGLACVDVERAEPMMRVLRIPELGLSGPVEHR
jgi:hypothetical protein